MGLYINGHIEHAGNVKSYSVHNFDSLGDTISEHPGWEIIFGHSVNARGIEMGLRGQLYDLSKVHGLVYNGCEQHHEFFHRKQTNVRALVISETFIDQFFGDVVKSSEFSFQKPVIENRNLLQFAKSTYEFLRSGFLSENQSNLLAETLVFEMSDGLSHDQPLIKQFLNETLNKLLFKEILIQLHKNLHRSEFNLDELSSELGVSKFHIIRTTKKYGGFTPHSYLSKFRLIKAKELLKNTAVSVGAVYSLCGFDDLSSFNKAFKKNYGEPPSKFRVRLKGT